MPFLVLRSGNDDNNDDHDGDDDDDGTSRDFRSARSENSITGCVSLGRHTEIE